jgi:PAS domain S-box-containing protein
MSELGKLTRAQLIERVRALESQTSPKSRKQSGAGDSGAPDAAALRDSGERLRAILETAVEGIITIDERGIVESLNPAAEKTFGYQASEIIGKNVSVLMPSPYREKHDAYMSNYLRSGQAKIIGIGREVVGQRKDGSIFPMDLAVSEVRLADRRLFTGFVRDVSDRKRAESQVHLVRSAIDQGFSAVLITDAELPDPRVLYINPAFAKVTGYSAEKIVGQPLSELASLSRVQQRLKSMPEDEPFADEISTFQTPEGERWGEWRFGPVKDKTGTNTHWLVIFRDITERKQLEKGILEISDLERQRIGQDLHDGLCQHLAGIELMSQVLEQKLAGKSKSGATKAGEIAKYVRDAISQTRSLARGLAPVTLESEGLVSALQELAANTEKMFGVACRFVSGSSALLANSAVAMHLYRIAQEAVSNAIKHGKAREIVIRFEPFGARAVLTVSDNGSGLLSTPPKKGGMGLSIMQYRASMVGGLLSVRNHTGGGVSVVCSVPAETEAQSPKSYDGEI